jgi:pimeloyl-ACP methyl ester carboxylesterase
MLHADIPGYRLPYIAVGEGAPIVLIHGSMSDYRVWSPVLGPLSQAGRVIVPSLRHFFPGHWQAGDTTFTIAQHTADIIAFLETLAQPVHLVGHSRGGHLSFRVAEQRPDLLRSLTLAEPGGDLDDSLLPPGEAALPPLTDIFTGAAARISSGDIDGGLAFFVDQVNGNGVWRMTPNALKQELRDNVTTLLGQIHEDRRPFSHAAAASIRVPTLLLVGEKTKPMSSRNVRALAGAMPDARIAVIPRAMHMMFTQEPAAFSAALLAFLAALS